MTVPISVHRDPDLTRAREVRVGVVGVGDQATANLLPALHLVPGVRVVGLADLSRGKQDTVGRQYRIDVWAHTVQQLLDRVTVDALVAACPPSVHEEVIAVAADVGIAAFVEKPPATSTERLSQLARSVHDAGAIVGVGMNFRWAEPMLVIRDLFRRESMGVPTSIVIQHQANKPVEPLWDMDPLRSFLLAQSVHPLDLLVELAGGALHRVMVDATARPLRQVLVHGRGVNGAMCSLATGLHLGKLRSRVDITTSTGIRVELVDLGRVRVTGLDDGWSREWRPSPLNAGYGRVGFLNELTAFVAAVARHHQFTPSLDELVPTYQVIDAICAQVHQAEA